MSKLEEKFNEYMEAFGEGIPVFEMPPMTDEEMIELIDEHIESGDPIEPDTSDDPNVIY